ncbi:toxin-antitoxin system TumE family protein [Fibrella arboris]|uniref:toxin-antitoxin system TumE family protein n=1 Tax=Fibrella arboris TaxID=3242486 RepID=UPI00351FCD22
MDQSVLFVRENYVLNSGWIDYSYHWQTADNQIIHRWDNAHPVFLPTSPYHQHQGSEENVVASEPMTLEKVLTFIASQLISS